ncbi:MAG: hypothetical protein D084_Lepto4C00677G0002 [Leptospirillum sp. Group IV 'UBA BS']|nr:MAG: hypothetical protein D084_Lepto4C00677G0002 [Leptospirillum sp. Group IV 'UBA BS']
MKRSLSAEIRYLLLLRMSEITVRIISPCIYLPTVDSTLNG